MSSTSHISDPVLCGLYEEVWDEPWDCLQRARALLQADPGDRLALLELAQEAVRVIIEDLEEHGEDNGYLYGDNGMDYFQAQHSELRDLTQSCREGGATSEVFSRWQAAEEGEEGALIADDLVADVMGDSARDLVHALAASCEDDAEGFVAVLQRFQDIVNRDHVADSVSAYVQNAQLAHHRDGDGEAAAAVFRAYAELMASGFAQGAHHGTTLATALAIAQLGGNDENARLIVDTLVPSPLQHPGLAFNLACFCAVKGERDGVLEFTRTALALGKSKDQFADSDFDAFRADPEFAALIR